MDIHRTISLVTQLANTHNTQTYADQGKPAFGGETNRGSGP